MLWLEHSMAPPESKLDKMTQQKIQTVTSGARERNSKKAMLMQSLSLNVYAKLKIIMRF